MRIRKTRGKDKYKLDLTLSEMRTLTIALANLSFVDYEDDVEEHGLSKSEVNSNHLKLFAELSKETNMYEKTKEESSEDVVDFF